MVIGPQYRASAQGPNKTDMRVCSQLGKRFPERGKAASSVFLAKARTGPKRHALAHQKSQMERPIKARAVPLG